MTFKKNETSPRNNFLPATQKPFPSLILSADDIILTWVPSLFFFSFSFFFFLFSSVSWVQSGEGRSNLTLITSTDALRVDGRVLIVVRAEAECCGNMWECVCFKTRLLLSVRCGTSGGGGVGEHDSGGHDTDPSPRLGGSVGTRLHPGRCAHVSRRLSSARWESSPHNINLTSELLIASCCRCCCRRQDQWSATKGSFLALAWSLWKELQNGSYDFSLPSETLLLRGVWPRKFGSAVEPIRRRLLFCCNKNAISISPKSSTLLRPFYT